MTPFPSVEATPAERAETRPGDELVPTPDVVMDTAFTVDAPPAAVWPWLVQLGKRRAGWYLPRAVERAVPRSRRAARVLLPAHTRLEVGAVIPDYGGRHATFTVTAIDPPRHLVHHSQRGRVGISWSIVLREYGTDGPGTRVLLRVRLAPVRRVRLAARAGGFFDAATVAGLAAGLRERVG